MGADTWDGTAEQVHTRWRLGKGVTMPFLLNAGQMATDYGQTYQTFTIIDHEGFIRFKTTSLIPMDELRDEVVLALADLPLLEEETEETVETVETEETNRNRRNGRNRGNSRNGRNRRNRRNSRNGRQSENMR